MMEDTFEREIKLALTSEAAYQRLLEHLPQPLRIVTQSNYFFDTSLHELGMNRWALRLRRVNSEENGQFSTLALKGPSRMVDGVTIRPEHEIAISNEDGDRIIAARKLSRNQLGILAELLPKASTDVFALTTMFSNQRTTSTVMINPVQLLFEVDASTYADGFIDWELEIELDAQSAHDKEITRTIMSLLNQWSIDYSPQSRSKFKRALGHRGSSPGN